MDIAGRTLAIGGDTALANPVRPSPRGHDLPKKHTARPISKTQTNSTPIADGVQSLRVLVVEDNLDAAESLARQLHQWGYHCRVCSSGEEALSVLLRYNAQVVLIDVGLPDMDGWRLARKIHEASDVQPILIAVTAYGEEDDFDRSQQAAISYHLVKPAYQPQLRQILGRIARQ